jgi:tRNA wybutosine-synthesizing protein 3
MNFEKQKIETLENYKKALKEGLVDKKIIKILDVINQNPNYYTTSSCSGRISLDILGKRKKEHLWVFKSHKTITKEQLKKGIEFALKEKVNNLYLKVDSFILHVVCKDLNAANFLLNLTHKLGLKRTGIIQLDKKIIVEILGLDRLEFPLILNNNLIINLDYLQDITDLANKKLVRNWERLEILYLSLKQKLNY